MWFLLTVGYLFSDEALNELLFWKNLSRLRFDSEIWLLASGISIKVATDASDIGWGGHTIIGTSFIHMSTSLYGNLYNLQHIASSSG